MWTKALGFAGLVGVSSFSSAQLVLDAHALPANVSFIPGVAMFFDLQAQGGPVVVEGITTALYAGAGETFDAELLVRAGTSLGGSATSGPGSSLAGWTSLGMVHGVQGSQGSAGLSLPVEFPRVQIQPGQVTGFCLWFQHGVGPSVFGMLSYAVYENTRLRLTTGDVRNTPFYAGQTYFPRHALIGSILYDLNPCYPNCDSSTVPPVLNVNDFVCFLGKFANGDSYANCDQSTTPPVLNVNDFVCFMQAFGQGCS